MSNRRWWSFLTVAIMLSVSGIANGQEAASQARARNTTEMSFVTFPGLPTCAVGSVQNGDPMKGPFIIFVKMSPSCSIPWHWHTANENLMMVSGAGYIEMKYEKPKVLLPGAFAMMPSTHIHQFSCRGEPCSLYVYSDAKFDIHYVDSEETEIPPDRALKAVRETAAKEIKPAAP